MWLLFESRVLQFNAPTYVETHTIYRGNRLPIYLRVQLATTIGCRTDGNSNIWHAPALSTYEIFQPFRFSATRPDTIFDNNEFLNVHIIHAILPLS